MDNPFIKILGGNKVAKSVDKNTRTIAPGTGLMTFSVIAITGASIGAAIGTYVFLGTVTLAGAVVVVESNPRLRKLVANNTKKIDALIFVASVVAIAYLGVTVAASLTVAGLALSLVYFPWLRATSNQQ